MGRILEQIKVRPIEEAEKDRWLELMRTHHYLGFGRSAGRYMYYVAESDGGWIALLSWAAAALHVRSRDQRIGWDGLVKRKRLHEVVNNIRFLILPEIKVKNLASKVLALNAKRIRCDWQDRHGIRLKMLETFVDPTKFHGTCYLAQGWEYVGLTEGFGKSPRGPYHRHDNPKKIFIKPLSERATEDLRRPVYDAKANVVTIDLQQIPIGELPKVMEAYHRPDDPIAPTIRNRRVLSLIAIALLYGIDSQRGISRFGLEVSEATIKSIGMTRDQVPLRSTVCQFLKRVDRSRFDSLLIRWLMSVRDSIREDEVRQLITKGATPMQLSKLAHAK